ncbi:MAG TPA: hypothetical protein VF155_11240 [Candidatus Dormibacteraeota bacterium]
MTNPWRHASGRLVAAAAGALLAAALLAVTVAADPSQPQIILRSSSGAPGARVQGFGTGFAMGAGPVQIRFNAAEGPTLWSGDPGGPGAVMFTFTVPNVSAGMDRVVATQNDLSGAPIPGTPVTAPFRVMTVPGSPTPTANPNDNNSRTQPTLVPAPVSQQPVLEQRQPAPLTAPAAVPAAPPAAAPAAPAAPSAPRTAPAPAPTPLFKPPQVASLWRVGGAVPQVSPTLAPISPTPDDPPVLLLAIDAIAMGGAIVVIALALQPQARRKPRVAIAMAAAAAPAPAPAPPSPPARRGFMFSDW